MRTTTLCTTCLHHHRLTLLRRKILNLQHGRLHSTSSAPSTYQYHWDTLPATPPQLSHSTTFFKTHVPTRLWTANQWRHLPDSTVPEVAFLGRSNVGKSSLLNALLGVDICFTGPRPGKTKLMHAWGIVPERGAKKGKGGDVSVGCKMAVLDMPGYGKGSRGDWGEEIMKYLGRRRQLRRAFLLIDAMHGPKSTDLQMLALFREHSIPHQVVLSKTDRLKNSPQTDSSSGDTSALQRRLDEIRTLVQPARDRNNSGLEALGEILCTCAVRDKKSLRPAGIDAVRWAVLVAVGLDGSVKKVDGGLEGVVGGLVAEASPAVTPQPSVLEHSVSEPPRLKLPDDIGISRTVNYTPLA